MTEDQKPPAGSSFSLLDGVTSAGHDLSDSYGSQHEVASDPACHLDERLAAFEDVFESEVGDTTIARARNIERAHGMRQVFLKFEGGNPSGTQKDRIAFAQALDAMRRGFDAMTVATCGNYGVATAMAAPHVRPALRRLHPGRLPHQPREGDGGAGRGDRARAGRLRARRRWPPRSGPSGTTSTTPIPAAPTPCCSCGPTARSPTRSTTSCATRPPPWPCPCPTAPRWPASTTASSASTAAARPRASRAWSAGRPTARTPSCWPGARTCPSAPTCRPSGSRRRRSTSRSSTGTPSTATRPSTRSARPTAGRPTPATRPCSTAPACSASRRA